MTKQRLITCPKCGLAQSPDNKYCHDCGHKLPQGCAAIRPAHALTFGLCFVTLTTIYNVHNYGFTTQTITLAATNLLIWGIIPALILAFLRRK